MTMLAWDTSPILHAGRIDRLDVLGDIASGWPRNVTTAAVVEEQEPENIAVPDWLDIVHVDGLSELIALATWVQRVSVGTHPPRRGDRAGIGRNPLRNSDHR